MALALFASTGFALEAQAQAVIGLAKTIGAPTPNSDGTFSYEVSLLAENLGSTRLDRLQIRDDLRSAFGENGPVDVTISNLRSPDGLDLNANFNPGDIRTLLRSDSLDPGETASVLYTLTLAFNGQTGPILLLGHGRGCRPRRSHGQRSLERRHRPRSQRRRRSVQRRLGRRRIARRTAERRRAGPRQGCLPDHRQRRRASAYDDHHVVGELRGDHARRAPGNGRSTRDLRLAADLRDRDHQFARRAFAQRGLRWRERSGAAGGHGQSRAWAARARDLRDRLRSAGTAGPLLQHRDGERQGRVEHDPRRLDPRQGSRSGSRRRSERERSDPDPRARSGPGRREAGECIHRQRRRHLRLPGELRARESR